MEKILINNNPTQGLWNEVIALSPGQSSHYSVDWDFINVHEKIKKYEAVRLLAIMGNKPVGILGGLLFKKFGFNHSLICGSSGGGGGVLIDGSLTMVQQQEIAKQLIQNFYNLAKAKNVFYAAVYCDYSIDVNYFKKDIKYTPIVDLPPEGHVDVLSSFDIKTRNKVRQGLQKCEVFLGNRNNLVDYLSLQRELYSRRELHYLNTLHDLQNFWDKLYPTGKLKIYLAKTEEKIVAGNLILYCGKNLFYKNGASTVQGMKLRANNALQYQIICDAIKAGFINYNMEGGTNDINSPLYGVTEFKLGFGAKLREFYRYSTIGGNRYLRYGLEKMTKILRIDNSFKILIYP